MSKSIKGLIKKDLLNLNHYKFSLLVFVVVFIVLGATNQNTLIYLPIMLMTMIGMIGLSTFSYDEIAKSDKYILTFPTNKKELVKAKYLLVIFLILIGAIISILITTGISYYFYHQTMEWSVIVSSLIGGTFGISLVECIQIPSIYKWGAEKGRIQMFILIFVIAGVIGGITYMFTKKGINIDMNILIEYIKKFGIYITIIVTCIMYYLSYKLSYKIYEKKEI